MYGSDYQVKMIHYWPGLRLVGYPQTRLIKENYRPFFFSWLSPGTQPSYPL